jgi:hypothetical protein
VFQAVEVASGGAGAGSAAAPVAAGDFGH